MSRRGLAAVLAAGAVLGVPATAGAHTGIKSYSPKPGGTASRSLSSVRVTFQSRVGDANLTVSRAGAKVSRGDGRVVKGGRQVRTRLPGGLKKGRYSATVRWLSSDGHVQSASWSFRLR